MLLVTLVPSAFTVTGTRSVFPLRLSSAFFSTTRLVTSPFMLTSALAPDFRNLMKATFAFLLTSILLSLLFTTRPFPLAFSTHFLLPISIILNLPLLVTSALGASITSLTFLWFPLRLSFIFLFDFKLIFILALFLSALLSSETVFTTTVVFFLEAAFFFTVVTFALLTPALA